MTDSDIAKVAMASVAAVDGEIAAISVRNPQAFVISSPRRISEMERKFIKEQWDDLFARSDIARIPLVIMQDGMQVSVIDKLDS